MKKCETEVFSRVTGFFRPVQDWNKGKVSEFDDRKTFKMGVQNGDNADVGEVVTETVG
jgi:hypothetical protein